MLEPNSRNEMVEKNMKLVTSRVIKLNNGVYDEDLFQEGCLGLIYAVDRFDDSKGYKFSTYATRYIDGYIMTYKNKDAVIRPVRKGSSYSTRATVYSLSSPTAENDRGECSTYEDSISDGVNLESDVVSNISINDFFESLNEKERETIQMAMDGYLQREIASSVGISQPHVHRMLKKMRSKYQAVM